MLSVLLHFQWVKFVHFIGKFLIFKWIHFRQLNQLGSIIFIKNKHLILLIKQNFKKHWKLIYTKLLKLHDPFILPFIHSRDFKISKKFFVVLFYFLLLIVRLVLHVQVIIKLYFFNFFTLLLKPFYLLDLNFLYDTILLEWEEELMFYYYYLRHIFWLWEDCSDSVPFTKFYLYSHIVQIANNLTFSTYIHTKNFIGKEEDWEEEVDYDQ